MKIKILKTVLLIAFFLDLYFITKGWPEFRFYTKTLLLPLLTAVYVLETSKSNKLFLLGLIFSFLGDLFLLFSWGFLPGLGSFLTAHIFYIICFAKISVRKAERFSVIWVLAYLAGLLLYLFPHLNEMKIPVLFYGITISLMLIFSFKTGNKLLIMGALFFVVSDSILATNLFVNENTFQSLLVMITYVTAQYLLVQGMIEKENNIQHI